MQEHPLDSNSDPASLYDTPKKLKCLIYGQSCSCSQNTVEPKIEEESIKTDSDNSNSCANNGIIAENNGDSHSNYVNITPVSIDKSEPHLDYSNYANVDLNATLEKFESSLQILRSAGFSQEELDALEDIPEHDDDLSTATTNTVHPSTECCNEHLNYMHMEPLEISSSSNSNKIYSDNVSRISHVSDPTQHSDTDNTISTRRSSSADFTKRLDDMEYCVNGRIICYTPTVLRKVDKVECMNQNFPLRVVKSPELEKSKENFKIPEPVIKNENSFVARFRDSVKIRRSSSVPSKSDKNRDSSSSNDSGVSTGSLKHHKGDFKEFETPVTNSKSSKKHFKNIKQVRKTMAPTLETGFVKSNSSDPLKNITFQFEEVATLTKSNSCDADTLTRRKKRTSMYNNFIIVLYNTFCFIYIYLYFCYFIY